MKIAIAFLGLFFVDGNALIRPLDADCGGSHCQLTRADAEAVQQFQERTLATLQRQADEIKRLRLVCPERES